MNKPLLASLMVQHGDNQERLADALSLSLSRLNAKINERDGAVFTATEIQLIIERYSMSGDTAMMVFFAPKLSDTDN